MTRAMASRVRIAQWLAIGGASVVGVAFLLPLDDDITKVASLGAPSSPDF